MGSAKKVVKKVANVATGGVVGALFGDSKGGDSKGSGSAYDAQQEAMLRQQKIERENQLTLQGSVGTESADKAGTVNTGSDLSIGDTGFRGRKKNYQNYSSSLGIM